MASQTHVSSKYCFGHKTVHFVQLALITIFLFVTLPTKYSAAQITVPTNYTEDDLQTVIVTEIVTEYETEAVAINQRPCDRTTAVPEIPGSTVNIQFAISNMNLTDIADKTESMALKKLLVDELALLYSGNDKFKSAVVLSLRQGSIIVDVKLEFNDALNIQERDQVIATIYRKVVLNGTLGDLQLQDLKVLNDKGEAKDINDACDITSCFRKDMNCYSDGTDCKSRCADNIGYCLNKSVCQKNNNFIVCKCKGKTLAIAATKNPDRQTKTLQRQDKDMEQTHETHPINNSFGVTSLGKDFTVQRIGNNIKNAYIGIIAAAAVAVVLLIVIIVGCGYSRLINKGKESDKSKLVPDENTVALEMLDEPPPVVGGVACQTMESFLLTKYMRNGVPPKPGYQHELIQTNDSFLLAKAQRKSEASMNDNDPTRTGTTPNATRIIQSLPVGSVGETEQGDNKSAVNELGQVPLVDSPVNGQGISNQAFVEDEGDIVPTTEVSSEDDDPSKDEKSGIGKKIIKV